MPPSLTLEYLLWVSGLLGTGWVMSKAIGLVINGRQRKRRKRRR